MSLSRLNRTALALAVYASPCGLPLQHARLASGCWPSSTGRDWLPTGFRRKVSEFESRPPFPSFLRNASSFSFPPAGRRHAARLRSGPAGLPVPPRVHPPAVPGGPLHPARFPTRPMCPLDAPHSARPHRTNPIARPRHRQGESHCATSDGSVRRGTNGFCVFRVPGPGRSDLDPRRPGRPSRSSPRLSPRDHQGILRTRKGEGTNMRVIIRHWFRPFRGLDPGPSSDPAVHTMI